MKSLLRVLLTISTVTILFAACSKKVEIPQNDLAKYVNPFIGTDGTGHTFPGPVMPFGMVAPGPDKADYTTGSAISYQLKDSTILGFSQTRMSGTGINEFGDILILPFSDGRRDFKARKLEEEATLGYYRILLDDSTQVELTTSTRTTFHRYTFAKDTAEVLLDFQHGLNILTDSLVLESDVYADYDGMTFKGMVHNKNSVERKYFFKLLFDHPNVSMLRYPLKGAERAPKFLLKFEGIPNRQLQLKIALSSVDVNAAAANMEAEIPHWNFEEVRAENVSAWNQHLNRIQIEAPDTQKETFYTAMYHSLIHPSVLSDVDGRYRGADDQVHTSQTKIYSSLPLASTHRWVQPLHSLLFPEQTVNVVNSLLHFFDQSNTLHSENYWGQSVERSTGNYGIPVLVDAVLKQLKGVNKEKAFEAIMKSIQSDSLSKNSVDYLAIANLANYMGEDDLVLKMKSLAQQQSIPLASILKELPEEGRNQIHQAYSRLFQNTPNGIIGMEGAGQMSAWYILSTLGFYPVNPANATFAVGEAQVSEATVYLQNGKTINIKHERQAPADSLQVRWNGKEIDFKRLTYHQLINGGELLFK